MNKVNIDELAREIHENARSKGFWEEARNRGEMLMLVISELAEAMEEHRDGNPLIYKTYTGKPEGILIELADAAIRILDTLYADWNKPMYGYIRTHFKEEMKAQLRVHKDRDQYVVGTNFAENLLRVTAFVVRAEANKMWLVPALVYIDRLAMSLDADLWEAVDMKINFNHTRPYKHGKAY